MTEAGREAVFGALVGRVRACRACPRMEGRTRVLARANGPVGARVMFVAEAPGRLGADRTGVPLSADRTGRNFDVLLATAGIRREDVFVTNAVLCNPRDDRDNNAAPSTAELRNCSGHLAATIEVVQPGYVVALGVAALRALALVCPHEAVLARDVGRAIEWHGRVLVPLYHPSPRALIHRPWAAQVEDYRGLGEMARGN